MKTLFSNKYIWLFIIIVGLQIPLSMIELQIEDRTIQRDIAKQSVRQSWTGEQEILASLLVIPYQEKVEIDQLNSQSESKKRRYQWVNRRLYITPDKLIVESKLDNQTLARGIYKVPVYTASLKVQADYQLTKFHQLKKRDTVRLQQASFMSIGVKDSRGLIGVPEMMLSGKKLQVEPGTQLPFYDSGFNAVIPLDKLQSKTLSFDSSIKLNGMEQLSFLTAGRVNSVNVKSDWPHPNFDGAFLPVSRQVSATGYSAKWETGVFSTNIDSALQSCYQNNCNSLHSSAYGVRHIQSVDIYLQSLRSVKYGLLVILATFCIFALYEIISQKISIHPISYFLTGTALAIFFLLLIALSEHMVFALAYWISCLACSGLIAFYVTHQSQSWRQGVSLMAILNGLYLILFFIIRSEDHALLSGSLLLFFLLAAVMHVTRKLDWYQVLKVT
ncbi:cell envelope integrity protein CreD [Aliikangiella coralliicola]|uniref:Cell envelope integrity protein CreD n=1 Tax=Aliikangiella coralliicola TaxID=2592383 RepID=A0A545U7Z7_9GAMM|nr:cell envelope integrity protein CreD [Aliikangiella coralliicola]TQV85586.1 cell envelope integrity protein CreD [Aliikangiella coralliicola]